MKYTGKGTLVKQTAAGIWTLTRPLKFYHMVNEGPIVILNILNPAAEVTEQVKISTYRNFPN